MTSPRETKNDEGEGGASQELSKLFPEDAALNDGFRDSIGDRYLVGLESLNSSVTHKFGGYRGLVQAAKVRLSASKSEDSGIELSTAHLDIVNNVLKVIALNGVLPYAWATIRIGLCLKVVEVCVKSLRERGWTTDETTFAESSCHLISLLDKFSNDAPFTIQRLTEVLLDSSQYSVTHKLLKALEKLLNVETTLEQVDDGTGEITLVEHHDHWLKQSRKTSCDKDRNCEGNIRKSGESLGHPNRENEDNRNKDSENVGKGLKRGVACDVPVVVSSKRVRGEDIEQPEAFVSSLGREIE